MNFNFRINKIMRSSFPCFLLLFLLFFDFLLCSPVGALSLDKNSLDLRDHEKKRVLVLNSYHMGFQWADDIMEGIRSAFTSNAPEVELYFEFLDTKRFPSRQYWPKTYRALISKYKELTLDLIITSDNNAMDFILKFRSPHFSNIPIVFCGVNYFEPKDIENASNITGVAEQFNLKGTIDLALQLRPNTTKLVFISGPLDIRSNRLNFEQIQKISPQFSDHLEIELLPCSTMKNCEEQVRQLTRSSAIFLLGRLTNSKGNPLTPMEQGRKLSEISNAPIYSVWDYYLGLGPVGGLMLNGNDQGKAAATMAIKILKGTPAHEIPVLFESPSRYMFDYVQMKRFGMKTNGLPENSLIINQPISFYYQYRKMVWGLLTFFFVSALLITFLVINVLKRMRVERELREHQVQLEEKVNARTIQLDKANRFLLEDIAKRKLTEEELRKERDKLREAISEIKTLSGLLPICSHCKKIRDDKGYWNQIESYIRDHSEAEFSHSICQECARKYYPDMDIYSD